MYPLQYGYPQSMQMVVQPQHPMMYQSVYHMTPYAHQPYGYGMGAGMVVQDPYGYSRRRHRRHHRYSHGGYPSYRMDTYTYPVTPHLSRSVYPMSVKPYVDEIITLSCCIVVLSLSSFFFVSSFLSAMARTLFVQSVCDGIGVLTPNTCNLYHHGIFFPRFSAHHCITAQQPAL